MKPEAKSKKVLNYTQAISKMIEFNVSENEIIEQQEKMFYGRPEDLFSLVIGILVDYSSLLFKEPLSSPRIQNQKNNIRFCANFLDNYKNTNRLSELNNYFLLIGAVAYYLADLPGSANVLCSKIKIDGLQLTESKIEQSLFWILEGDLSKYKYDYPLIEGFKEIVDLSISFFSEGKIDNKDILIQRIGEYKNYLLSGFSDREIILFYLFYSVLIKKLNNSSILLLPAFTDIDLNIWLPIINKKNFIKELWPAQILLGENSIFKGKSAVIQMPTSAGKTKSTELIIRSAILSNRTNLVVVIAPFKSLCHEISFDYEKAFYKESNIKINEFNEILDDDQIELFSCETSCYINVLTPEKFYYLLKIKPEIANKVGLIIIDEGHQFDSGERGITFELLLTTLNVLLPSHCQKILISAVIGNSIAISNWLLKEESVISGQNLLPTQRSVGFVSFSRKIDFGDIYFYDYADLNESFGYVKDVIPVQKLSLKSHERKERYFPEKMQKWPYYNPNSIALFLALKMCCVDCVCIYSGNKDWIPGIQDELINELYIREPQYIKPRDFSNEEEIKKLCFLIEKNIGIDSNIWKCANFGIFVHHADLPYGIKLCIEEAIHDLSIKFLLCTSTLAQGVNLPIKYLFIPSTMQGGEKLKIRDFQNLIGRVGRAGKLTEGNIIFTNPGILGSINLRNKVFDLLNPNNAEDCKSSLFHIFEPIKGKLLNGEKENETLNFKNNEIWLKFYFDEISIDDFAKIFEKEDSNHFPVDYVIPQLFFRKKYVHSIESFLLGLLNDLSTLNIEEIAKSTLAYQLADDNTKNLILSLFLGLFGKIISIVPEEKRSIYSKTMQGVENSIVIDNFVQEYKDKLTSLDSNELVEEIWPLIVNICLSKVFHKLPDISKIKRALFAWIDGKSYFDIFLILKDEPYKNRKIRIEDCVALFDNNIGFNASILIDNVKELLTNTEDEDQQEKYLTLQQRIKYGLPENSSIVIYELGFCDRCLAQELSELVVDVNDKDIVRFELLQQETKVLEILDNYPSYFRKTYEKIRN